MRLVNYSVFIFLAFILDLILGDPYNFPHPVKLMGKVISLEEKIIRKFLKEKSYRKAGFFLAIINIGASFFITFYLLKLSKNIKYLYEILTTYIFYTTIAARSLSYEAKKVVKALDNSLEEGRNRLKYIVGRETDKLNREEILRATIETVAENTSDGVIAPIFYGILLGPPMAIAYKMVNTMDSMIGYKNEKYINLGRYPAIIDDLFNYIPARLTSFLMILSSSLKYNFKNGILISLRDNKNHLSPNAGWPESTVAGLLGLEIGGASYYKGELVIKPTIGDKKEELSEAKVFSSIEIMYRSEVLLLVIYFIISLLLQN